MTLDIKRIVVPLDFSGNSILALDYAHVLAQKFGAALHLVHVCDQMNPVSALMDAYSIAHSDWTIQRFGEEAERWLNREIAALGDVPVTTEVVFGRPATGIVDVAAANQADLIVMGTYGHGAMMHLLMGNVAEHVVRTAPCPVLTIREPKVRETVERQQTGRVAALVAAILVAGVMLAPGLVPSANAQDYKQTTTGSEVFRTYCASCHGTSARGDGPLASAMSKKPSNLTEIAKRNGGQFPSEMVFRTIDGRQAIKGHGGPDMPVWGDAFGKSREAGDADRVKAVIQSLVEYLDSIQLRPAHDQQP